MMRDCEITEAKNVHANQDVDTLVCHSIPPTLPPTGSFQQLVRQRDSRFPRSSQTRRPFGFLHRLEDFVQRRQKPPGAT